MVDEQQHVAAASPKRLQRGETSWCHARIPASTSFEWGLGSGGGAATYTAEATVEATGSEEATVEATGREEATPFTAPMRTRGGGAGNEMGGGAAGDGVAGVGAGAWLAGSGGSMGA